MTPNANRVQWNSSTSNTTLRLTTDRHAAAQTFCRALTHASAVWRCQRQRDPTNLGQVPRRNVRTDHRVFEDILQTPEQRMDPFPILGEHVVRRETMHALQALDTVQNILCIRLPQTVDVVRDQHQHMLRVNTLSVCTPSLARDRRTLD